ncbi:aldolase [Calocera viscosa TUFC12733]|uniref:Fructose-bisphosphate aldolase n=1 Tax=Calocera viscosa (strain TUFC12733) TaxID=1330018 RepID=A0A167HVQ1_CALVF|nr:aldolase [Calocera viscosa TUFC12733]
MSSTIVNPSNNRTLSILQKAKEGNYGVIGMVCYDMDSVMGFRDACEKANAPGIIMLFPISARYGGSQFVAFCRDIAHQAKVPMSLHMDHAVEIADIDFMFDIAEKQDIKLDSIMIDSSRCDTEEEGIAMVKKYVGRANKLGMAIEVELGRLEGGEAGLAAIAQGKQTDPDDADHFIKETGAQILAPSIGNLHGHYINPPNFNQEILKTLKSTYAHTNTYICLHGTDELPDSLFAESIKNGVTKMNMNSWMRDPYIAAYKQALIDGKPLPDVHTLGVKAFADAAERFFTLFGSAGKA